MSLSTESKPRFSAAGLPVIDGEQVEARNVKTLEIEDPATQAIIVRARRRNSWAPRYRASARPHGSIHGQRWLGLLEFR